MNLFASAREVRTAWGVLVVAVLMATAGCSASSSGAGPHGPGSSEGTAAASAGASPDGDAVAAVKVRTPADRSACDGVQVDFLSLAGVSARWDLVGNPFDASVASAVTALSSDLRVQARSASSPRLRVAIDQSADALFALTEAITTRQQSRLNAALDETRAAYAALPRCAHREGEPAVPAGTAAQPSVAPSASAGPVVDPGCNRVKSVYATIGTDTAGWQPDQSPFDKNAARGFGDGAEQLRAAASAVESSTTRTAVEDSAAAFQRLSTEMAGRDQDGVNAAVVAVQHTTATLAALCPLV